MVPIDILPLEILYIILKKLDNYTFANCLHVNKKWQSITLSIVNSDKTDQRWKSIFELHHMEETFKIKSYNLSYRELFKNSLYWNLNFSYSNIDFCFVPYVKKINIYRDNIIVVDNEGVKYFDVHTLNIKRNLQITECFDFNERDAFIVRATQVESNNVKLFLYGKTNKDDDSYELDVQRVMKYNDPEMNHENSLLIGGVNQYVIENNCCYIMSCRNILSCHMWKDDHWSACNLGRFYGKRNDVIYAMNVLHTELFLLIKWGQMLRYCYDKRNFQEACCVRMPRNKIVLVKMVHKYCLVIGVSGDCEFRITRLRNDTGFNFYKFECPNLTCVTQHGEMLLLGFSDGRIELYMPRAVAREDMFKCRIHVSDFISGQIEPEDLIVVSIDVFEDLGQHYLFISTQCFLYQLLIKHDDATCVWDNIHEMVVYHKYPIGMRYARINNSRFY